MFPCPANTLREFAMFCLPIALFKTLEELGRRKRGTDEKSLHRVDLAEHLSLIFCFDALRDHVKAERLAQRDNRSYLQHPARRPPESMTISRTNERSILNVFTGSSLTQTTMTSPGGRPLCGCPAHPWKGGATVKGNRRAVRSHLRSRKIKQTTARHRHCFVHCPPR